MLIKRAIISVYDKTGLSKLVNELVKWNVELISTSGTADIIRKMGHEAIIISNYTNMPEGLDGLFKTLHPMIHVGIIGNPRNLEHKKYMEKHKIKKIDLVVVNFYPFEEMVQSGKYNLSKAASHIDLGGVALARTAAKASFLYGKVTVLTSPNQYESFLDEMEKNNGDATHRFKLSNAIFAFEKTFYYDKFIRDSFSGLA
jgi:phosphoribosylaminoimidazolecarboxamide formyltransferase/IMP cyclohydrolase